MREEVCGETFLNRLMCEGTVKRVSCEGTVSFESLAMLLDFTAASTNILFGQMTYRDFNLTLAPLCKCTP